jgi:hypothetical protein
MARSDVFFSAELVIDERVRPDIARPALHEPPLVARGQVVQFQDAQQIVANLDEIALAQPSRLYRGHSRPS